MGSKLEPSPHPHHHIPYKGVTLNCHKKGALDFSHNKGKPNKIEGCFKKGISLHWQHFWLKILPSMKNKLRIYASRSSCIFLHFCTLLSSLLTHCNIMFLFVCASLIHATYISILSVSQEGLIKYNHSECIRIRIRIKL